MCRFELRGRTLVLPADASADAIHRALDAMTTAAPPPAAPVATAPHHRRPAGKAQRLARAQRKYKRGPRNAAAPPRRTPPRERSSGAAGLRILPPRGATAKLPPRPRHEPPPPPPPAPSDQRRFRVRLPAAAGAPARAVAVAVAHDATLDALREGDRGGGRGGRLRAVRVAAPPRLRRGGRQDGSTPGDASLAALGLDRVVPNPRRVAMPADSARPRRPRLRFRSPRERSRRRRRCGWHGLRGTP